MTLINAYVTVAFNELRVQILIWVNFDEQLYSVTKKLDRPKKMQERTDISDKVAVPLCKIAFSKKAV